MQLTIASSLLALLSIATALTIRAEDEVVDFSAHPWRAPGPTDSRGPCPGLNTLANHGFLPRNGRSITIPMIVKATSDGYNIGSDIAIKVGKIGLLTSREADTIDLEDLKLHGNLEHDASLSREDEALGNNFRFNETIFKTIADSNPGSDVYNITSAAQVHRDRLADSLARNPNATNTNLQAGVRATESAFYLTVMSAGDPDRGEAPKKFVNVFFREERLPIQEGWKRSSKTIDTRVLGPIGEKVTELSDWKPTGTDCAEIVLNPPESDV